MAKVRKRTWKPAGWKEGDKLKKAWAVDYTDNNGDRQRKQFPTSEGAHAFRVEVEGQLRAGRSGRTLTRSRSRKLRKSMSSTSRFVRSVVNDFPNVTLLWWRADSGITFAPIPNGSKRTKACAAPRHSLRE